MRFRLQPGEDREVSVEATSPVEQMAPLVTVGIGDKEEEKSAETPAVPLQSHLFTRSDR